MGYIDLKYEPKNDIVCKFYLEPRYGISFDDAAEKVASESSIGTWTEVETLKYEKREILKLAAKIFSLDPKSGIVEIAYPTSAFEKDNVPQMMSSFAGNIFGMKDISGLRLLDVSFPKEIIRSFKGPKFGINGIRKLLKVYDRPLLGSIIKPKMGLSPKYHAKVAHDCWVGGVDIVKDDENLTNQNFNKFKERIRATLKMRDMAEKETGEKKIYMPNITAETNEMLKRARLVKDEGGEYVMVDIITVGWSALQTLRNENEGLKLVLHSHRAGHAAMTRNERHGIAMAVIAKLIRLIGLDQLHIGTIVGKMAGGIEEVLSCKEILTSQKIPQSNLLAQDWGNIKSVFPVASGGLHPGHVQKLYEYFGKDVIIQMGGGIHWNPRGSLYGAMGARQALDAVVEGIPLKEYARSHRELQEALDKFGIA
jgi:ribulose-bisphosphate carboxylase large chain